MEAALKEEGLITIPLKIREKLGLKPGDILDFTEENGRLIAVKSQRKWVGFSKLPCGETSDGYLD